LAAAVIGAEINASPNNPVISLRLKFIVSTSTKEKSIKDANRPTQKVLSKTDRDKQKTSANKEISNFYNTPTRTIPPNPHPQNPPECTFKK
jgi:hypothetical protein